MNVKTGDVEQDTEHESEFPTGILLSRNLMDIDLFLGFLERKVPGHKEDIIKRIMSRLGELKSATEINGISFVHEPQNLSNYPELEEAIKRVTLGMIDYQRYADELKKEKATIKGRDFLMSYVPLGFSVFAAVADVMERDEAIELCKEYVDFRTDTFKQMMIRPAENLEQMFAVLVAQETGPNALRAVLLDDGRLVARIDKCMWHSIQSEYGDPELAYVNSCYYDFYAATQVNPDFVLTRKKTRMQGDDYCDFCWHDMRIDKKLEHPQEDFFESL